MADIAKEIGPLMDKLFPVNTVRIIAEPGRFFCTAAYTLAVTIISRRERYRKIANTNLINKEEGETKEKMGDVGNDGTSTIEGGGEEVEKEILYYLSDGIYGSFNNIVFDHAMPIPNIMKEKESDIKQKSSLFGPTCDSIDVRLQNLIFCC
jgi:ornithine decarboxylase